MQRAAQESSTCPGCGGALEETSSGGLGCMVCLLRAGIGGDDPAGAGQDLTPNAFGGDERFGVYEIERREDGNLYELGRGAMGVTYRAIDTSLQRKVALKIIKMGIAERSAEARERFMREARTAASLRHENIATVFQFGIREETGQCFYAMELIEGETLEERVRRTGPLSVQTTVEIAQQITAALVAAEKRGLVHRDLKPANLMLVSPDRETADASTQRGGYNNVRGAVATALCRRAGRNAIGAHRNDEKTVVKIIDFGVAKALNAPVDPMSLTRGGFVGTPAFASPEQFDPESVRGALDVRSDIYSLGVTLWFALTGKTLFAGRSVEEIRHTRQSNALPTEQLRAARVRSRLRSLLGSMLALEPAARPGTHDLAMRLQRCSAQANDVRRIRVALAAAFMLILGVSAFLVFRSQRTHPAAAGSASNPAMPEKSIAVLPFENLSNDREDASFADGVQDDLLTKLAGIADLKVISRTSVMQYRPAAAGRNMRQIGDELRVSHALEGSVRKTGAWLRINAQLIDTRTDSHVWAKQFDGDLKDLFAIQSEIAQKVAEQLHAKISAAEKLAIEQPPTADLTAFDLYARAKSLTLAGSNRTSGKDNLLQAADLLNEAVAHDPTFFQAYCQLAHIHDLLYFLGDDHTPERLALAEAAVQAAFRLRPSAGEAHLARAGHFYRGNLDYDGALAELEVARQTLPKDARLFELKGYIERRRPGGNQEEALRSFEYAIELDPRNKVLLLQTALSYNFLRRYRNEEAVLDRALAVEPNDAVTKAARAFVKLDWKADTRPLHEVIDEVRAKDPAEVQSVANTWLTCALAERDPVAAANALAALGEGSFGNETVKFSPRFGQGLIARMTKDDKKARSAFTAARAEQEKIVQTQPDHAPALCVLGLIDAGLGRKEEALREGRLAIELLPIEKDEVNGTRMIVCLAMIAAWVGNKDLAYEQLAVAMRGPDSPSYGQLKLLPFWDPLRGDPRFDEIVASLAPKEAPNVIR